MTDNLKNALEVLDLHYEAFGNIVTIAAQTGHPVPMDTRGWSQILVSTISGVRGVDQKKGADLVDGSDVKAASTWAAIDSPRFNGVLKAGTKAEASGTMASLDDMPHLYFVLWDHAPETEAARCRVWAVRTQEDDQFRTMACSWYEKASTGEIKSTNFQLHPPRGANNDTFRNTCGNLDYPKLFHAERPKGSDSYKTVSYAPDVLKSGSCAVANVQPRRKKSSPG